MSSEPPGSGDAQEERPATESPGRHIYRRPGGAGRVRWRSIVTILGVLAVAGGIGLFLFLNQNSGSKPDQAAPMRELACPYLQHAADAYNRGDRLAYDQAISQAAHIAKDTLQTSGEAFGEPERVALELDLESNESPTRVERLLELALGDCERRAAS